MPERDYKQEYKDYHGTEEQIEKRANWNKSRKIMEEKGKVHKGDGKDVHHKDHNPNNTKVENLSVLSEWKNRSDNQ